ncbi:hypothetical protein GW17_00031767 [Ensete ventricosum]|nr:hypothetical protein GW17_00031767 [Ensete ventricosum]RZR94695.1 hypothetical protein BHM03_00023443 [Ensete ventricosum]
MTERDASEQTDLDRAVAAVVGEAEGAQSAVRAVKAEHIALALVTVGVVLALDEEARRQKRSQPRRPPALLLRRPSSALFCCPQWCYIVFPPNSSPVVNFTTESSGSTFPLLVIADFCILTSAFLLVSYYTIVSKCEKGDGPVEGTDRAVCPSEFREEDSLRLLPKCSHAFHVPGIDAWLKSQSNRPLCRANFVSVNSPAPPPPPAAENSHPVDDDETVSVEEIELPCNGDNTPKNHTEEGSTVVEIRDIPLDSSYRMVSANQEMVVYCFDTLIAHYNSEQAPPPGFEEGQQ